MSFLASMLLLLFITGCDVASSEQRCDPKTNRGCARNQACAIDQTGTALCTKTSGQLVEGDICEAPVLDEPVGEIDDSRRCAAGLGCIAHLGVARCLRFCEPESDVDQCPAAGNHPMSRYSNCGIVLDGRPDTGACALPCQLHDSQDSMCPADTQCRLAPGESTARCGTVGQGQLGDACGPACTCGAGLVCVQDPFGQACRTVVNASNNCSDDAIGLVLPGTRNPVLESGGTGYAVCVPCQVITSDGISVCASVEGCLGDAGQLAFLDASQLNDLVTALGLVRGEPTAVVGAIPDANGGWTWGEGGEPVPDALWLDGNPASDGNCAVLTASGQLETRTECELPAVCRHSARPTCSE